MFENTMLKGIKVLGITKFLAGPTACQILADLGADVIKLERRKTGDEGRTFGPLRNGESGWYHAFNRDAHSITMDYRSPEGRQLFLDLAKECDIIIENNAAGVMKKNGLDYDSVAKVNPRIIYASVSGYGQSDSPYLKYPALDGVAQAAGGIISVNGFPDPPGMKVGVGVVDQISGYMAAIGVLAALHERSISGKGQFIDVCMLDAALNFCENAVTYYSFTGQVMPRMGNGHSAIGMTGLYDSKEGKSTFYMNIPSDKFADIMFDIMGKPEFKDDPRYNTNVARHENMQYLDDVINEYTSQYPRDELLKFLQSKGIACMPVNTVEDCVKDPHFAMHRSIRELEHHAAGKYLVTMTPFRPSRTPLREPEACEDLGQSNELIYKGLLGKSDEEYQTLLDHEVI